MKKLIIALAAVLTFAGCSDFLEPLPNGHYTDKNLLEYPSMIRGFVEKSYDLLPKLYSGGEYVYLDGATDDAVITAQTHAMRRFAVGTGTPASDPFKTYWVRDYRGIMYVNKFLKDRLGINTRYMIDNDQNRRLQRALQGDAYALRAWWQYDLLRKWGGRGTDGRLLGFPIVLEPVDVFDADAGSFERATYEQCVEQILKDCDSALVYLPAANRDWLAEDISVQGAVRWHRFDGLAVKALKAMTYLQWASPAFNPDNDLSRWENAAKYAAEVMDFKLTQDGAHGFDPTAAFAWTDPNSPEIIWSSDYSKGSTLENLFYPDGFLGTGGVGPTQNLVDAFPAANGYPIDHPEANYDKNTPYANRDPRFYSILFYNGAEVRHLGRRTRRSGRREQHDDQLLHPQIHLSGLEQGRRQGSDDAQVDLFHALDPHVPDLRRGGQPGVGPDGGTLRLHPQAGPRLSAKPSDQRRNTGRRGHGGPLSRRMRRRGPGCFRNARAQRTPHRTLLRGAAFPRPAPLGDGRFRTQRSGLQAPHRRPAADRLRRGRKTQLSLALRADPLHGGGPHEGYRSERRLVQLGVKPKKTTLMKKILATLLAAATLAGCYDEYVKDYDYSGVYIAYQYDLRTFVVGEGMKFTVGSVLAGVMDNERDRSVYYALDDELVTGDLAPFNGLDELGQPSAPFTAFDVMSGKSTSGTVSQSYVTTAVKASGIKELTPLPREYFTVSDEEKMTIRRGRHTGTITVRADSAAFLADAKAGRNPYYAVGFRITSADADTILLSKSFEVIAVRYENKLFGNYYHGGETQVVDARGEELSKEVYPTAVPSDEGTHGIYTLTTDAPDALTTNYIGTKEGSVRLTLDGKEIRVSGSVDGSKEIEDLGSRFNDARLLQNRKLFLHYRYPNGDGTFTVVRDTLTFRNRIRDGVNEWQDENPKNYD